MNRRETEVNDDRSMLELIISSRIYDIGATYNWGGRLIDLYYTNYLQGYNSLVSTWESIGLMTRLMMEDFLKEYSQKIG